jgi:thiol-disulfide isomerase/thioredoxin
MQVHNSMRQLVWLLVSVIIAWQGLAHESAAQQPNRRGRPGEVITPAALSERPKETLKAGDKAPDFTLPLSKGGGEARLADLHRDKPLVLLFGSISCPPFRKQVEQVERLYQKHKDQANFAMVYVREAHPDSVIYVKDEKGAESLEKIVQTNDLKLRTEHAQTCARTLELSFTMLVDKPDNQVNTAYAGWPIRLVIVGTDGKIIDPGAPGPRGFDTQKVARWLEGKPTAD